jgi:hypothetical protein
MHVAVMAFCGGEYRGTRSWRCTFDTKFRIHQVLGPLERDRAAEMQGTLSAWRGDKLRIETLPLSGGNTEDVQSAGARR